MSGAKLIQVTMLSAVCADSSSERRRRALLDNGEPADVDPEPRFNRAQAAAERLPDPPQGAQRNTDSGRAPDAQPSARQPEAGNGAADPVWDDWAWGGGNAAGRYQQQRTAAPSNRWGMPNSQQGSNGAEAGPRADGADEGWDDADGAQPDITSLTPEERERLLRIAPFAQQVEYFRGDPARLVQRWAGAALVTIVASTKAALLAAGAVTFPLWWPWVQAANKNRALLAQHRYMGLWRARALRVEVQGRRMPRFSEPNDGQRQPQQAFQPRLLLLAGDDSGARTEIEVPFSSSFQDIREGEPVELLVVATQASFGDFKALKEAYLPESSLWVADYPYVDRDAFLDISLEIERARADSQPSVYTNGSSRTANSAASRP